MYRNIKSIPGLGGYSGPIKIITGIPTSPTYTDVNTLTAGDYLYVKNGLGTIYFYDESGNRVKNNGTSGAIEPKPEYPSRNDGQLVGQFTGVSKNVAGQTYIQVEYTFVWEEGNRKKTAWMLVGLVGKAFERATTSAVRKDFVKATDVTWEKQVLSGGTKDDNDNNSGGGDDEPDEDLPPATDTNTNTILYIALAAVALLRLTRRKKRRK